tara:strand:- start:378 stop:578 length:201 start_codon:yes stop_codon:yes gene_type:complete
MLISKNNPIFNLKNPNSTQFWGAAPKPKGCEVKKKSLTTPSGKTEAISILNIVPINIPINNIKKIN